jgi:serine/threonine protein kinase
MSVRKATRTMTGTPYRKAPEVILGQNQFGNNQVTIKFSYDNYVSVGDVRVIEEMIENLSEAAVFLHDQTLP